MAAPAGAATRLGTVTLHRCADDHAFRCGSITRALDPSRPHGKHIRIALRWRPRDQRARRRPAAGGGRGRPGLPVDRQPRSSTRGIYGAAAARRATCCWSTTAGPAASALIDCPSVQRYTGRDVRDARSRGGSRRCAREIDARYGRGAPTCFATAYAADDLAAVLRALRLGKVDLYGDSYGTCFVQAFIARHPRALHSVVLDSAYPRARARPVVRVVGRRRAHRAGRGLRARPGCPRRAAPSSGSARCSSGCVPGRDRADARDADPAAARARRRRARSSTWSRTPAPTRSSTASSTPAVRAALAGDDVPLLRLAAQSDELGPRRAATAAYFSRRPVLGGRLRGLPAAVLDAARPPRRRAARRAIARRRPARSRRSPRASG